MKRILFFSVSIGAGHDQAAKAIIEEINYRYPGCRTMIVDTFRYVNPVLNKVIVGSYMESLKFSPKIWGYLYDQAEEGDKLVDLSQILSKLVSAKMEKLITDFAPEAVVCTHAFPAGVLSVLKEKTSSDVPLIGVMTDYTVHQFWIQKNVDRYVIPCDELKHEILDYGVPEDKIMTTGIPLRRQFTAHQGRAEARVGAGLAEIPTILVMGGGLGLGEIEEIVGNLAEADLDIQIVTVAGKNDRLRTKLELAWPEGKVRVLGFVENVAQLMAAADFIITKPGGLTTAEVLSQALPMIIVNPLPGQEERNTQFLLNSGVAVKARRVKDLVPQLEILLGNETRVKHIREMAVNIGRPNAAGKLVDYLAEICR